MNNSHKIGIRAKLALLLVLSLLGMISSLLVYIQSINENLYEGNKTKTRELIEAGMGVMGHFHHLEKSGELSRAEAEKLAMDTLASAIFGGTGYYWINDTEGVMLMNPNTPDLTGKPVMDTTDSRGKYLFQEFIKTAVGGGGWVEYYWPRPGSAESHRKISYVEHFRPWGWVLGTGLYLDDMEREIREAAYKGLLLISVTFSVLILSSMMLSNRFMKELNSIAIRDSLTGLFTRRFLYDSIPIYFSKHDRNEKLILSAVFFDIDHFKQINDTYGHSCGDQVIAGVGKTIINAIRKDDLAIRYGGEEFVAVMLCNNRHEAVDVAERIRAQSQRLVFKCRDKDISITLSAGMSFRMQGEDIDSLLHRADENLYMAKSSGRDRLIS